MMKRPNLPVAVIVAAGLVSAAIYASSLQAGGKTGRYAIVATASAAAWRIDTTNGEVSICLLEGCRSVESSELSIEEREQQLEEHYRKGR